MPGTTRSDARTVGTGVALAIALCAAPTAARTGEAHAYALDPVHTRVLFAVSHAGFSKALGTVSGSTGALLFDPQDWSSARLVVNVPLTRIDLGDEDWNQAVLGGRLLDGEDYPTARFVSTRVQPIDAGQATVCGNLTLHGVTRPLCMEVTMNAVERHPMPPWRHTAGFSATASLSRSAYGIDAWSSMIGDTVELRIEAEAVRDDDAAAVLAAFPPPKPVPPAETPTQPAERAGPIIGPIQ